MTATSEGLSLFRSVLYAPASNQRALDKALSLDCDAVIFDLEDAVAPDEKIAARDRLAERLGDRALQEKKHIIVRINALSTDWGRDDLVAASNWKADAILLPKVDTPADVLAAATVLDEASVPDTVRLWAMVETAKALLNLGALSTLGESPRSRLACLVVGTNDLVKELRIRDGSDDRFLLAWLMQIIVAARAGGLSALDGVTNDFSDLDRFARVCQTSAAMGFDGKTLIHPKQIDAANQAFSPSPDALADARAIVEAFALNENAGKGVISLQGRMVERLHLAQAQRLLAQSAAMVPTDN